MGFNFIIHISSVMLYYTYIMSVDRVSLGLEVLRASQMLHQASSSKDHSSWRGAKPWPETAARRWEPLGPQHQRVPYSKISAS